MPNSVLPDALLSVNARAGAVVGLAPKAAVNSGERLATVKLVNPMLKGVSAPPFSD